jgi:hypothetical protein
MHFYGIRCDRKREGTAVKTYPTFVLICLLFLLIGCIPQSLEEAQVDFCQALTAYGHAVQELEGIDADTTVDELNAARENVAAARQAAVDTAADLRSAQVRRAEEAWQDFEEAVTAIPGDATLGEAAATIRGQANSLQMEIERVRNMSCRRR